jgi:predicted transposase YdaD
MVKNTQYPPTEPQQMSLFSLAEAESADKISVNPLEEVKNAFDITCKQAFVQNPEAALRLMGFPEQATLIEKNVELQRTSDLKVDLAFWVEYPVGSQAYPEGEIFLLHIEFQRQAQKNIPQRIAEYKMELALANAERDNKGRILNYPKIRSYVVYFWPEEGKDDPGLCAIYEIEVRYHTILLYEKTLAELKQMALWEYMAFAPILKGMDEQQLKEAVELLEKYAGKDQNKRSRLLLTLAFYFKRKYKRNINEVIEGFDTMISNTAETGYYALTPEEARQEREAGRQEGMEAGIQKGRQEGRQEGMEAGIQKVLAMLPGAERDKIRQSLGE